MTAATADAVPGPDEPAGRPFADCTADSAGGLTFDIALPGEGERWDAGLLLRRRGTDPVETVRLPLVPAGEGTFRAVLPSTVPLAEGRWNAYLVLGESGPRRLLPGRTDLGPLLERVPRSGRTWLGVRIPYGTRHGNLAVRAWLRWPHAEAADLRLDSGGMTLHGRLFGAALSPEARIELRQGHAGQPVLSAPVTHDGPGFVCRLPLTGLVPRPSGEERWDLWLRTDPAAEAVRVGRILDDLPDKRYTADTPKVPLAEAEGTVAQVCYTADNDLSLLLAPVGGLPAR
ncbi:hypothetical protein QNO07_19925 [Streptomyces sp. 549]|uniref:hypothetical protein n=1 Tax=Streptomyces sp. 549 TaxID=3049076 RepID=UPI0024C2F821|nr:hypothetical protein [Streptomyces sp. 549]MDK1475656.1 hypothetical protein [Streptomyces sp. 549]